MTILVCGGRTYGASYLERAILYDVLDALHATKPLTSLIHGAASGADTLAAAWARAHDVMIISCSADWRRHGLGAGPIRNQEMLAYCPDLVVAFPGGRGTADMVRRAKDVFIKVMEVPA